MRKVLIIYGGNSKNSRLYGVHQRIDKYLVENNYDHSSLFVCDLPPEALIKGDFQDPEILKAHKQVEDAEMIIILTPVFKSTFSGILKAYLDLLPEKVFDRKTILPFAMGGTNSHILMIDYALKPLISYLGSKNILKGGFIHNSQVEKINIDEYLIGDQAEERITCELDRLEVYGFKALY
ncbi:NAD(P)H-dependent oxidoreductase [Oceanobacillus jeddahense]|uniref:NAD(P)H-dependent oxidoreductase n=1 Tax=Oceanobacillus jeddahense TaxID=1462527 RepID=UPI0036448CFF